MRTFLKAFALVAIAVLGISAVEAQEVATAKTRVRMVRAFCTTGPCNPAISFSSGGANITRLKQPKPLSKRKIGKIRLRGVQSTPLPNALDAILTARFVYDTVDPDGDCPDLGSDSVQTLATSSMFCRQQIDVATCGGDLLVPLGLFDPRCTDVRVTLLDLDLDVYEFGMVGTDSARVATQGVSIVGREPDCSSGGSGCP
jgi:hypothetical protein